MVAYPNVAKLLFGRPLAIEPIAAKAMMESALVRRVLGGDWPKRKKKTGVFRVLPVALADAREVKADDGRVSYSITADGVGVIPIADVLTRRFDWLAAECGFSSYEAITASLAAALDDTRVRAILLDVNSPGGDVDGMLPAANAILQARDIKPIWAVANSYAMSAAYALAGSAEHLMVPELGEVGSIGCFTVHVDQSAADAALGLKYSAIYSGARKIDGWSHAPLTKDAREATQASVDNVRNQFAALVGRQGRISADQALATEAATFPDFEAVSIGLADEVGTLDDALAALTARVSNPGSTTYMTSKPANAIAAAPAAAPESVPAVPATPAAPAPQPVLEPAPARASAPGPGQACPTCGHIAAEAPAAYGAADVARTMELCSLAGASLADAQAFVKAKTPIAAVSEQLLARKARAADTLPLSTDPPGPAAAKAATAAGWDDVIAEHNRKHGLTPRQ